MRQRERGRKTEEDEEIIDKQQGKNFCAFFCFGKKEHETIKVITIIRKKKDPTAHQKKKMKLK